MPTLRRTARLFLWSSLAASALMVLAALAWWRLHPPPPLTATFTSSQAGVSLRYSTKLAPAALTATDRRAGLLLRLAPTPRLPQAVQVTLRTETGLRPIVAVAHQNLRDALLTSLAKAYPERFPGYHQLDRRDYQLAGRDAAQVTFTYTGPSGQLIQQRLLVLARDDNTAVYLAAQATAADFAALNPAYFDPLFASVDLTQLQPSPTM